MNRRGFLQMMVGGVAAAAAVRTFPFRVFSFAAQTPVQANLAEIAAIDPVVARAAEELGYRAALTLDHLTTMWYDRRALDALKKNFTFEAASVPRSNFFRFHQIGNANVLR